MSDRERLRRKEPVRSGPIRNWSTLYNGAASRESNNSGNGQHAPNEEQPDHSWSDVVSHGVKLGYHVVEEHIRQGQRVAQQMNNRSYNPQAMGSDIQELLGRIVRYYTDLGSLWGDLANSLLANPEFLEKILRPGQPPAGQQANNASVHGTSTTSFTVAVEVISTRPAQVTLALHPQSERLDLATYGLHAGDPQKPPLTDTSFEPSSATGCLLFRVRVPDGQPPDIYTGVVVEKSTNLPRGTVSVRITGETAGHSSDKL